MADDPRDKPATSVPPPAGPLLTREVFLDTEAYRRIGFDTAHPSVTAMLSHVADERLELHITDITSREIRRQIAADADRAMGEVRRARTLTAKWRKRAPIALGKGRKVRPVDAAAVGDEAYEGFRTSLRPFTEHYASRHPAPAVFEAYFQRRPPFDSQGGKSVKEFPDAFVIATLEEWCNVENTLMYVVTADNAMLRAVEASEKLIPVTTLDDLLQAATVQHSPDVELTVETILEQPEFDDQLAMALDRCIGDLVVIYMGDLMDGEAGEPHRSGQPSVVAWTVISAFDKGYGLIIEIEVNLIVDVDFEDVSTASYNSEDEVYIGAEPDSSEIEETANLRMFIQVHENCAITRAELLTTEVNVYGPDENYK